ncbi:unnamed protein product, partial [Nesidiocoris tenuis]
MEVLCVIYAPLVFIRFYNQCERVLLAPTKVHFFKMMPEAEEFQKRHNHLLNVHDINEPPPRFDKNVSYNYEKWRATCLRQLDKFTPGNLRRLRTKMNDFSGNPTRNGGKTSDMATLVPPINPVGLDIDSVPLCSPRRIGLSLSA